MYNPFERKIEAETDIGKAHANYKRVLRRNAIKEGDFQDLYRDVPQDIAEIERLKRQQESERTPEQTRNKMLADVLEAIIFEQVEYNNWLGENALTIKTSEYDDLKNGVDMVVEFAEPETSSKDHLALGTDVTFGEVTSKKFKRIEDQIRAGKLTFIKYFKTADGGYRGEKSNVPEVVIGTDPRTIEELMSLVAKKEKREPGTSKALAEHRIQIIILEEIRMQLVVFEKFAISIDKPDIAAIYMRTLATIEKILEGKKDLRKKNPTESLKDDRVFYGMSLYLQGWERSFSKKT